MNVLTKSSLRYAICSIFLYFFTSAVFADNIMSLSDRKDRWEISWNYGFGIGYNFDEHWALDFDLSWNDVGYSGKRIDDNGDPQNVSGSLYTNNMQNALHPLLVCLPDGHLLTLIYQLALRVQSAGGTPGGVMFAAVMFPPKPQLNLPMEPVSDYVLM